MPVYKKTLITDPKYIAGLSETQKTQLSQSEKAKETFISKVTQYKTKPTGVCKLGANL